MSGPCLIVRALPTRRLRGRVIAEYKLRYADYGKRRLSAVHMHLDHLERLLTPTAVTRVSIETIGSGGGGPGEGVLWARLADVLKITETQKAALASRR